MNINYERVKRLLRLEIVSAGTFGAGLIFAVPALYLCFGVLKIMKASPFLEWPSGWFSISNAVVLVLTSRAFYRENSPLTDCFYLMIPASNLEKCFVKWFVSLGVGFFAPLLMLTLFSNLLAAYGVWAGIQEKTLLIPAWDIFTSTGGLFLLLHSIVFCGSAFYKSHPLAKTIFTAAVYLFVVAFVGMAVLASGLISQEVQSKVPGFSSLSVNLSFAELGLAAKISFGLICPVFLYLSALFRLAEAQANA